MKTKREYLIVLEFDSNASPTKQEIKDRFQKLSLKYHPDKNTVNTTDKYRDIIAAKHALLNNAYKFESAGTTDTKSKQTTDQIKNYEHMYLFVAAENIAYTSFITLFIEKAPTFLGAVKWVKLSSNNCVLISSETDIFNDLQRVCKLAFIIPTFSYFIFKLRMDKCNGMMDQDFWKFLKDNMSVNKNWINR